MIENSENKDKTFEDFPLDTEIISALTNLKFTQPSLIQYRVLP